jgi:hypothetical protein
MKERAPLLFLTVVVLPALAAALVALADGGPSGG